MIKETYVEGITKDSFQTSLKLHGTERRELGMVLDMIRVNHAWNANKIPTTYAAHSPIESNRNHIVNIDAIKQIDYTHSTPHVMIVTMPSVPPHLPSEHLQATAVCHAPSFLRRELASPAWHCLQLLQRARGCQRLNVSFFQEQLLVHVQCA